MNSGLGMGSIAYYNITLEMSECILHHVECLVAVYRLYMHEVTLHNPEGVYSY